jgi:hypothetical protein
MQHDTVQFTIRQQYITSPQPDTVQFTIRQQYITSPQPKTAIFCISNLMTVEPILMLLASRNLIGLSNFLNEASVHGDIQILATWTYPLHTQRRKQIAYIKGVSLFHIIQRKI